MGLPDKLQELYDSYVCETARLMAEAGPADGLLGMKSTAAQHPCHEEFYKKAGDLTASWSRSADASPEEAEAAVRFLLEAHGRCPQREAAWMFIAAEVHALPLIPLLKPADARSLLGLYDRISPVRTRLPVQKQVAKALKKQSAL